MKRPPSKLGCFSKIAEIFITAGQPLNQPNSQIIFQKNSSQRDLYTMTLLLLLKCFETLYKLPGVTQRWSTLNSKIIPKPHTK